METNELKTIWQTLANEKLIGKELAEENIERIINIKSSETIKQFNKKLKKDFLSYLGTSVLIIVITIFATLFLEKRGQHLPVQGYVFLLLAFSFYFIQALNIRSKTKFLNLSNNTLSILESLEIVRDNFKQISKKETIIMYCSVVILTVFANILINKDTDFSNYKFNSLQGYVFVFSIFYLITLPWLSQFIYKKKFASLLKDINHSIEELEENI